MTRRKSVYTVRRLLDKSLSQFYVQHYIDKIKDWLSRQYSRCYGLKPHPPKYCAKDAPFQVGFRVALNVVSICVAFDLCRSSYHRMRCSCHPVDQTLSKGLCLGAATTQMSFVDSKFSFEATPLISIHVDDICLIRLRLS